jgi:hemin uptake protein HemP
MQDDPATPKPADAVAQRPDRAKAGPRRVSSSELFAGTREIVIDHEGRLYQLRITQNGKLILTA